MTENTLTQRNREALRLLHEAAQALSDGELDYCRRLHTQVSRTLSPRTWPRIGAALAYLDTLRVPQRVDDPIPRPPDAAPAAHQGRARIGAGHDRMAARGDRPAGGA